MKLKYVAIMVMMVCLMSACSKSPVKSDAAKELKTQTVEHEERAVSFKVPATWTLSNKDLSGAKTTAYSGEFSRDMTQSTFTYQYGLTSEFVTMNQRLVADQKSNKATVSEFVRDEVQFKRYEYLERAEAILVMIKSDLQYVFKIVGLDSNNSSELNLKDVVGDEIRILETSVVFKNAVIQYDNIDKEITYRGPYGDTSVDPIIIELRAKDLDGDEVSYLIVKRAERGVAEINSAILSYTPNKDFETGTDVFSFKAADDDSESRPVTVNIVMKTADIPTKSVAHTVDGVQFDVPSSWTLTADELGKASMLLEKSQSGWTSRVTKATFSNAASKGVYYTDFVSNLDQHLNSVKQTYVKIAEFERDGVTVSRYRTESGKEMVWMIRGDLAHVMEVEPLPGTEDAVNLKSEMTTLMTSLSFGNVMSRYQDQNVNLLVNPQLKKDDTPTQLNLDLRQTDIDGGTLSYKVGEAPKKGTVAITPSSLTYTPERSFVVGDDSFRITVSDNNGGTSDFTVTINRVLEKATVVDKRIGVSFEVPLLMVTSQDDIQQKVDESVGNQRAIMYKVPPYFSYYIGELNLNMMKSYLKEKGLKMTETITQVNDYSIHRMTVEGHEIIPEGRLTGDKGVMDIVVYMGDEDNYRLYFMFFVPYEVTEGRAVSKDDMDVIIRDFMDSLVISEGLDDRLVVNIETQKLTHERDGVSFDASQTWQLTDSGLSSAELKVEMESGNVVSRSSQSSQYIQDNNCSEFKYYSEAHDKLSEVKNRLTEDSERVETLDKNGAAILRYFYPMNAQAVLVVRENVFHVIEVKENCGGLVFRNEMNALVSSLTVSNTIVQFVDIAYTINYDDPSPQVIKLVATDLDGDTLQYAVNQAPLKGEVSVSGLELIYTPKSTFKIGSDTFTINVTDQHGLTTTFAVVVNMNPEKITVEDSPLGLRFSVPALAVTSKDDLQTKINESIKNERYIEYMNKPLWFGINCARSLSSDVMRKLLGEQGWSYTVTQTMIDGYSFDRIVVENTDINVQKGDMEFVIYDVLKNGEKDFDYSSIYFSFLSPEGAANEDRLSKEELHEIMTDFINDLQIGSDFNDRLKIDPS